MSKEKLIIKPREKKIRHQVRFWSNKELYDNFSEVLARKQIIKQDAFNEFMKWAIRNYK